MKTCGRYFKVLPVLVALVISGLTQAAWGVTPQIRAGANHTVTLRSDGTVWTTGANGAGQLGDGTRITRMTPVQVGLLGNATDWMTVAAGDNHTLALKADGTLWAWGDNAYGQVGDGSVAPSRAVPVQIGSERDWLAVAAGGGSSFALKADGTLWAWGKNDLGQLGDGATVNRRAPVQVGLPGNAANWLAVAVGGAHALALKADGSLWAWGVNQYGQIGKDPAVVPASSIPARVGADNDWKGVAAGGLHSLALRADGSLWGWGDNQFGQVGDGTTINRTAPVRIGTDRDWAAIVAGDLDSLAVKRDGTLWSWGDNTAGQLGDGTTTQHGTPVRIAAPSEIADIIAVAAGAFHSLAARANGELYAWGDNGSGQLGGGAVTGSAAPFLVATDEINWADVEPGGWFTVARRTNGTLWSWGDNAEGQLGDGTLTQRSVPAMVGTATNWFAEATGWAHTVALRGDGTLWTWGDNGSGQLGDGTALNRTSPARITAANNWTAVAAGDFHNLALQADGTLWAWGNNTFGQLGDKTTANRMAPVQVVTGNPGNFDRQWVAIAAGGTHSLALQANGTLWAWGDNDLGQLGNSAAGAARFTPKQVVNFIPPTLGYNSNWVAIAAGLSHSLALQADGTLWAWGSNFSGQLGNGNAIDQSRPVQVLNPGAVPYVTIAAGDSFTVARQADGTLWAWGRNTSGQLGNGATLDADPFHPDAHPIPSPEKSNGTDWVAARNGGGHSVALKADGTLWGWGSNNLGQLGLGTTVARNVPTPLVEGRIEIAATTLGFGPRPIGASSTQTITIGNSGTAQLSVGPLSVNNPLFSATPGACATAVKAGKNCTINVVFNLAGTPAPAAGVKEALLTIASNDPSSPVLTVNLSGTAVAPFFVNASVSAGSGTINPSGAVPVVPGTSQIFTITPAAGFHIADVALNGVSRGPTKAVIVPPVNADGTTVTASFAVNDYNVTTSAGAGGAVSGPVTAKHGELKTYTITPNPGYHVADVKVDDKSVGAVTTLTLPVIANTAVTATFVANTYTITRNAGANGAITGPATANHGETPVFTITPNPGYHVVDVQVNGSSKGAVTSLNLPITGNTTVAATFAVNVFIPDGDANNDGKVDVADALKALRVAVGLETIGSAEYLRCDVAPLGANGMPLPDKQITVADALVILRKVVGLTSGW